MTRERAEELKALFTDPATLVVVSPLIEELADVEDRIQALKKEPMVRYHPRDRSIQRSTPSARLYKDLLAKETDIVRILLRQLNRDGDDDNDSPLREYLRRMEEESRWTSLGRFSISCRTAGACTMSVWPSSSRTSGRRRGGSTARSWESSTPPHGGGASGPWTRRSRPSRSWRPRGWRSAGSGRPISSSGGGGDAEARPRL